MLTRRNRPPAPERPPACRPAFLAGVALVLVLAGSLSARAQGDPNACDEPDEVPDVIVGDIHEILRHGVVDGVTAFSIGTVSCNVGTCWLNWIADTPDHPVIGQNAFRLKDGRFEQIGQSWLKHGFFALSEDLCFDDCQTTNGEHLGVHCSDPYSAAFNGWQTQLGPKSQVNPTTGAFPYPFASQGVSGNATFKRLQIKNADIDPALNGGAAYFVEAQYVSADDAASGADGNNVAYRPVTVVGGGGFIDLILTAEQPLVAGPGIQAWSDQDPAVQSVTIPSPNDGFYVAASKVTDLGGGNYRYEYAIQNVNSARGARAFSIPLPWGTTVSNIGFHDVDYHSGETYSGTDWSVVVDEGPGPNSIVWSTPTVGENPQANALRWGTLYNFRFDADAPPAGGELGLELFDPGGRTLTFDLPSPVLCDNDGICEPREECTGCPADCGAPGEMCCGDGQCVPGESPCSCAADCGVPPVEELACRGGVDDDCDGLTDCGDPDCCGQLDCNGLDLDGDSYSGCDCDDGDAGVWYAPGEVLELMLDHDPLGTTLAWSPPLDPGGDGVTYDAIRSSRAHDFMKVAVCVVGDGVLHTALDDDPPPAPGAGYFYLVRAENGCPDGLGSLGKSSANEVRSARTCP